MFYAGDEGGSRHWLPQLAAHHNRVDQRAAAPVITPAPGGIGRSGNGHKVGTTTPAARHSALGHRFRILAVFGQQHKAGEGRLRGKVAKLTKRHRRFEPRRFYRCDGGKMARLQRRGNHGFDDPRKAGTT